MSKFIGRLFNIGFAKETTRGTIAINNQSTYWIPAMSRTWDEEVDTVVDESSIAVIEDSIDSHITSKRAKGSLEAVARDQSLGLILLATMGQEAALGAVETGVKDHNFTVLESAQHQSLTVGVNEPNESAGVARCFPLGMIEKFELDFEIGKFCTYKADITGQYGQTTTATVTYTANTTENIFLPQHGNAYFATTYSGLGSASALINLKKGSLSIAKNLEEDQTIGNLSPYDRLNKQFAVEFQLEINYNDRTMMDTYLLADAMTSVRFKVLNSDVTIGAVSHPTLTIDLARTKLQSVARKIDNNNIVTETIKGKAFYSMSDAIMIKAILRNTITSLY